MTVQSSIQALASQASFALVACQRSGTHLLGEILNSSDEIALLAEPFAASDSTAAWCRFAESLSEVSFPPLGSTDALELIDQYFAWVHQDVREFPGTYRGSKANLKALGLDIKYNQLKSVQPLYADLRAEPTLVEYFRTRKTPIVHLVRNNLAHIAISLIVSNIRKIWQNHDDCNVIQGQYRISVDELLHCMRWVKRERDHWLQLSKGLAIHTCVYEDLIDDLACVDDAGSFPADTKVLKQIAAFLGVSNRFQYNGYLRKVINKPYAELIENLDEVIAGLKRSKFAEFAPSLASDAARVYGDGRRKRKGVRKFLGSFLPVADKRV